MNFLFSRFLKFFLYCSTVLDGAFLEKIYQIINPLEAMRGKFYQLSIFRKPYLNSNKILLHKKFVFSAEDDNRSILHIVPHPRHSQWALAKKSSFVWEVKILQKVIKEKLRSTDLNLKFIIKADCGNWSVFSKNPWIGGTCYFVGVAQIIKISLNILLNVF